MATKRLSPAAVAIGLVLWLLVVGMAWSSLVAESAKPGRLESGRNWPANSKLTPSTSSPTLVLFVHPKCPCTRAALEDLDRLISKNPRAAKLIIAFIKPSSTDPSWGHTDLWDHAKRIPGATVVEDVNCAQSKLFSAYISGTAILYSPGGQEVFRGGLTPARGHEGESLGIDSIGAYFKTGAASVRTAPVYGCELFSHSAGGAS